MSSKISFLREFSLRATYCEMFRAIALKNGHWGPPALVPRPPYREDPCVLEARKGSEAKLCLKGGRIFQYNGQVSCLERGPNGVKLCINCHHYEENCRLTYNEHYMNREKMSSQMDDIIKPWNLFLCCFTYSSLPFPP